MNAPPPNAYEAGKQHAAQGISNQPLAEELAVQTKTSDEPGKQSQNSAANRSACIAVGFLLLVATSFAQTSVSCTSQNGNRKFCRADTQNGVLLQREDGRAVCKYGSTWGFNAKGIYVNHGCSAEFLVNSRHDRDDRDHDRHADDHSTENENGTSPFRSADGSRSDHSSNRPDRNSDNRPTDSADSEDRSRNRTIPVGTSVQVRLDQTVTAQNARQGDAIRAMLVNDLVVGGTRVASAGDRVVLRVTEVDKRRAAPLSIQLASLQTDGNRYNLTTDAIHQESDRDGSGNGSTASPFGAILNSLANGDRRGDLQAGSVFTFRLLSEARPEGRGSDHRH